MSSTNEMEQLKCALAAGGSHRESLGRRLAAELEFAAEFATLAGRKTWPRLVSRVSARAAQALADGGDIEGAMAEAEAELAPIGRAAKCYRAHCVGHAHIDMNWMWSWPETVAVTLDTFTTVLKLMEEFDEFCFTQSQGSVYEIVRRYDAAMFEAIRRRVAEGRWEVAAPQWVEGDKNLASGESLTRHLLYTRRFMKEHFGLEPEDVPLDWEPDTFGHAATIPTIVSRGGVRRYYMCRGGPSEKPAVFWWAGPDGRRVLVNLEHTWYNDHAGTHNVRGMLSFCRKTGLKDWMLVYGVGDHGGGPTRRDLETLREMNGWPIYPTFRMATTREYYEVVEAAGDKLPTVEGELNFEFSGCYTSQSDIKQHNRAGENLLERTEWAAATAWRAVGRAYPTGELRAAWQNVLFGHFHDILPGSGVKATREYQSGLFQETAAAAGTVNTQSLRAVAAEVDTSAAAGDGAPVAVSRSRAFGAGAGRGTGAGGMSEAGHADGSGCAFVVFNPNAWERSEVVRLTVWDWGEGLAEKARFVARLADGTEVEAQRIGAGRHWDHAYVDLAVPVTAPAMGYTSLVVRQSGETGRVGAYGYDKPGPAGDPLWLRVPRGAARRGAAGYDGPCTMENEHLAVWVDSTTGAIGKLVHKASGRDLSAGDGLLGAVEYVVERPGGMSAWIVYDPRRVDCPMELVSLKAGQAGPHLASYVATLKINDSTVEVTYSLAAGEAKLGIAVSANWLERGGPEIGTPALRLVLPFGLTEAVGRYETPFGSICRPADAGQVVPALRWVDVTGRMAGEGAKRGGCCVLNDGTYGYSLDGATLRATLIRSSYEPDPLPEAGRHEWRFALVPHAGQTAAESTRKGMDLNRPLAVVSTGIHGGRLGPAACGMRSLKPEQVILSGIKQAEDGDGLIVRLHETAGKAATAHVELEESLLGRVSDAAEVDLLERPVAESTARKTGNGFRVSIPASGLASVRVRLA